MHRVNGTETDFSFPWAIRGILKPQAQEFSDACRVSVDQELKAAKRRFFATYADTTGLVPCELSGGRLEALASDLRPMLCMASGARRNLRRLS
ncbi:conserved hypothetical protein [Gluconacetobacter diazotrophicus PA1 5]|uniref:Uncharacterized protein n=1 Tax=Gluconacetobacter diazotrophicus (strain ATCC 49037 / DSM 5601 / CCUG 37298 / CIP 103539 / LMG 7603 / PAl5) TaxID=272568 RepID=A9HQM3_GLUDA|nr:conserved hypothetical protein [Gluconacetobacter diazotrophicus PA1 5]